MEQQAAGGAAAAAAPQQEKSINSSWGWLLALGTILIILGFFALEAPVLMSASAALMLGWFLVFAGIAQMIVAFINREGESVAMNAMLGVLYFIFGIILANGTLYGNLYTITLFLAIFFMVDGIFKMVLALQNRKEKGWGWLLAGSIISILFSMLIFSHIYGSSLILIGILIGVQLTFMGMAMLFEGFDQRTQRRLETGASASKGALLIITIIAVLAFAFVRIFQ